MSIDNIIWDRGKQGLLNASAFLPMMGHVVGIGMVGNVMRDAFNITPPRKRRK